jgi:DNA polymerase family B, exonuclease domain
MRDAQFSSKAYGTHEYKEVTCEGRTQFDLLLAIQRDHKLSSYSLNSVGRTGACYSSHQKCCMLSFGPAAAVELSCLLMIVMYPRR